MAAHVTKRTTDESHESRHDHLAETIPQRMKVSNTRRCQASMDRSLCSWYDRGATMEFGLQFFPDVNPAERAAAAYWDDALHLTGLADELGYTTVRTVEHYFHPYGGYSPDPIVFLAAASQRTRRARLVTGAVLPIFNNPLKLAGADRHARRDLWRAASTWASLAPFCRTSSLDSDAPSTRAGPASRRASSRSGGCSRIRM